MGWFGSPQSQSWKREERGRGRAKEKGKGTQRVISHVKSMVGEGGNEGGRWSFQTSGRKEGGGRREEKASDTALFYWPGSAG